jgi:hypothetical protein
MSGDAANGPKKGHNLNKNGSPQRRQANWPERRNQASGGAQDDEGILQRVGNMLKISPLISFLD